MKEKGKLAYYIIPSVAEKYWKAELEKQRADFQLSIISILEEVEKRDDRK